MKNADYYDYRVTWSQVDKCFVGRVTEWPSLAAHGATQEQALSEIRAVVEFALEDMAEGNETPPAPLSQREYSGKLVLRMPPEMHAIFAAEAERASTSLNQLLLAKLQASSVTAGVGVLRQETLQKTRQTKPTKKPKALALSRVTAATTANPAPASGGFSRVGAGGSRD